MRNIYGSKPVSRWSAGCLSHDGKNFSGRGQTFVVGTDLAVQLEVDIDGDFNDGTLETWGCTYSDADSVTYWKEARFLSCTAFRYVNTTVDGKITQNISVVSGNGLIAPTETPFPDVGDSSPFNIISGMGNSQGGTF